MKTCNQSQYHVNALFTVMLWGKNENSVAKESSVLYSV